MKTMLPDTWPQFFTATISEWKPLLEPNKYKDILVDSLRFLVDENRIILNAFVIMINHIHVIWQAIDNSGAGRALVNENIMPGSNEVAANILPTAVFAGENTRPGQKLNHPLKKVQESFMKFTAQKIKFDLIKNHPEILKMYIVNSYDRDYNFWQRRSLGIELFSPQVFQQKLNYIHNNPVKAGLCDMPEHYYYSSAKFYHTGIDDFNMISHYDGS